MKTTWHSTLNVENIHFNAVMLSKKGAWIWIHVSHNIRDIRLCVGEYCRASSSYLYKVGLEYFSSSVVLILPFVSVGVAKRY